ncbi:MAG: hypothetical protein I3274_04135 [Candidatus Moeniiplasma glomeromycotorum]|nr:hypothetical protein [Candidatus Moeniiplasma glomeromycotorum]MCE8167868.1 hypothetical protein [Candidatus Moeniiplasma glomeromycotorum]
MEKKIKSLYDHYKDTPKKLKIVCDWDEVIQPCEPWACWKTMGIEQDNKHFPAYLDSFWKRNWIEYSAYGSKISSKVETGKPTDQFYVNNIDPQHIQRQKEFKNSPNFYQEAPFLTIAEDLLRLVKEGKVDRLIFLTAYDKREFPNGDERKKFIFSETFGKSFALFAVKSELELIPFESETQGESKTEWIKENAPDYDIVIDDNPNICRSLIKIKEEEIQVWRDHRDKCMGCSECCGFGEMEWTIIAPYYPATENQHHSEVLLVRNEVSELKKEDFWENNHDKKTITNKKIHCKFLDYFILKGWHGLMNNENGREILKWRIWYWKNAFEGRINKCYHCWEILTNDDTLTKIWQQEAEMLKELKILWNYQKN